MGNELYVKLAKESGLWDAVGYPKEAVAFANLVAAHEREACAKVCDELSEECLKEKKLEAEDTASYLGLIIRLRGLHNASNRTRSPQ